jgi:tetratricopeptide (TPR) repeat protein
MALANLYVRRWATAREQAQQALALFAELDQPLSSTAVHATLAAAALALGDRAAAEAAVHDALDILDGCGGEGPDFPHRDYWLCAQTLDALGRPETARRAREQAALLLGRRAERISDPTMRASYLTAVPLHADIMTYSHVAS